MTLYESIVLPYRHSLHEKYDRHSFQNEYGAGIDVLDRDWDNLIILDGCRWDVFSQYNEISGKSKQVVSKGSATPEFFRENFSNNQIHDTVLITVNIHATKVLDEGVFHSIETPDIDDKNRVYCYDPETILELSKSVYDKYPNKRLIFHFMQPHSPYLGRRAEELRRDLREEYGFSFFVDFINEGRDLDTVWESMGNLLEAAREGYISRDQLRSVYIENMKLALSKVELLLEYIDGKSVISADHGELLGEQTSLLLHKRYGHGERIYEPGLRIVPWHVAPHNNRREIIAELPTSMEPLDQERVKDTLRTLGYAT
jgi:hypothetical protein